MPDYLKGKGVPYEPAAAYGEDPSGMASPPSCGEDPNSMAATNRGAAGGYGGSLVPKDGGSIEAEREQGYSPRPD